jgi:hypothetical protein
VLGVDGRRCVSKPIEGSGKKPGVIARAGGEFELVASDEGLELGRRPAGDDVAAVENGASSGI